MSTTFTHEELEAAILQEKADRKKKKRAATHNKSKHSKDSDEEDEKVLDPNDLEGQEDGTVDMDGEIKITPFNMKDELEEGHFDKQGTFIFKKDKDQIKDQWLDDIDWVKIKATEAVKRKSEEDDEDSDDERYPVDLVDKYKKMIEIMHPGETVQKAIRRLGGNKASWSASNRWKKKKEASDSTSKQDAENEANPEKLQLLTSLADEIVHSGDMDVYQQTFEKMSYYVSSRAPVEKSGANGDDPSLDMFGDEFEEKVEDNKVSSSDREPSPEPVEITDSEVMWEFKWEAAEDAKVYGPYPTSQMQQWVEEKYFEDGVMVRQVGKQDKEFCSSKRMDFELYL